MLTTASIFTSCHGVESTRSAGQPTFTIRSRPTDLAIHHQTQGEENYRSDGVREQEAPIVRLGASAWVTVLSVPHRQQQQQQQQQQAVLTERFKRLTERFKRRPPADQHENEK